MTLGVSCRAGDGPWTKDVRWPPTLLALFQQAPPHAELVQVQQSHDHVKCLRLPDGLQENFTVMESKCNEMCTSGKNVGVAKP
mmetsp:Transcript_10724/g.21546  ORF Transcript_10724/g.21546 Transcript_10724/m.21546 type:complete len:83 (-) Transcript_10724:724-972(-)